MDIVNHVKQLILVKVDKFFSDMIKKGNIVLVINTEFNKLFL